MRIVNECLLTDFRRRLACELCGKPMPYGCDPHHVFSRGAGRLDIVENLVSLDRECHNQVHSGVVSCQTLLEHIAKRERISTSAIESIIYYLRQQPKEADPLEAYARAKSLSARRKRV